MNKKKPVATLDWSLDVMCPECNTSIDLVELDHELDYRFSKYIFTNSWDALKDSEVDCPHCNHQFGIDRVEY